MKYKFKIGDTVHYTNPQGVYFGEKKVVGLEQRTNNPTYLISPTDTPWFSVDETSLRSA